MAQVLAFPYYTREQSKVCTLHPPLGVGDLIVGDRPNVVLASVHDGIGPQPRAADAPCCRSRSVGCHCSCIFAHCALWAVDCAMSRIAFGLLKASTGGAAEGPLALRLIPGGRSADEDRDRRARKAAAIRILV